MHSLNLARTPMPTILLPLNDANTTPTNPPPTNPPTHTHTHTHTQIKSQADEMLALGSLGDQSKRIRQKLPKNVQTLFFSATWTDPVALAPALALALALTDT